LWRIADRIARGTGSSLEVFASRRAIDILFPEAVSRRAFLAILRQHGPSRSELQVFPRLHIGVWIQREPREDELEFMEPGEEGIEEWIPLGSAKSGTVTWNSALWQATWDRYGISTALVQGVTLRAFENGH
jgi:hypothetical protein